MKLSQKRAIWYKNQKRKVAAQRKYIEENNLVDEFKTSGYKTMTWFLISKGIRFN